MEFAFSVWGFSLMLWCLIGGKVASKIFSSSSVKVFSFSHDIGVGYFSHSDFVLQHLDAVTNSIRLT